MGDRLACRDDLYFLLTQDPSPGGYFRWMRDSGFFVNELYRELVDLVGVPQDALWHPEGDAFEHTCCTLDAMAEILSRKGVVGRPRVRLMLAMLCHDLGKALATKVKERTVVRDDDNGQVRSWGRWSAPGHDVLGVPLAKALLGRLCVSGDDVAFILPLVRWHMAHTRKDFSGKSVRKLARELFPANLDDLLLVMEADCRGRGPASSGLPQAVTEELIPKAVSFGLLSQEVLCATSSARSVGVSANATGSTSAASSCA